MHSKALPFIFPIITKATLKSNSIKFLNFAQMGSYRHSQLQAFFTAVFTVTSTIIFLIGILEFKALLLLLLQPPCTKMKDVPRKTLPSFQSVTISIMTLFSASLSLFVYRLNLPLNPLLQISASFMQLYDTNPFLFYFNFSFPCCGFWVVIIPVRDCNYCFYHRPFVYHFTPTIICRFLFLTYHYCSLCCTVSQTHSTSSHY